jgi:hypothetical protein
MCSCVGRSYAARPKGVYMLNPKFAQAYAVAKAIPLRIDPESKKKTILFWCKIAKKAIAS